MSEANDVLLEKLKSRGVPPELLEIGFGALNQYLGRLGNNPRESTVDYLTYTVSTACGCAKENGLLERYLKEENICREEFENKGDFIPFIDFCLGQYSSLKEAKDYKSLANKFADLSLTSGLEKTPEEVTYQ